MRDDLAEAIEGRLIGQRRMIAQILALGVLGPDARMAIAEELLHEAFMPTGQKGGPDGVPDDASTSERMALTEQRLIIQEASRLVKQHRGAPNAAEGPTRVAPPAVEDED